MTRLNKTAFALTLVGALFSASAWAQHEHHKLARAAELKWAPVPSLPKGAQIAVIEGPMNQPSAFTVRLKFPANYRVPAHTHPAVERVTVLSGEFNVGVGKQFDAGSLMKLGAGDTIIMQPGTAHYVLIEKETVVQLHGTGPWGITYLNAADDPRNQ